MPLIKSIIYVALTGLASFYIGALLPREHFCEDKFPYKSLKFEKNGKIYDKLNIRKWKGEILDMSKILKIILPKQLPPRTKSKDVHHLIKETCVAEFIHWILCVVSLGNIWIWESVEGILIWLLCVIGNLPFIFVQRYNRPHLIILRDKLEKREKLRQSEG